ncbi:MAG TPA: DUF5005 domain-containing protein [Streptosporangiaceae bacterium]|nr:DUF5005 domain-containing protein [Streptosporangiaceae bacterium]
MASVPAQAVSGPASGTSRAPLAASAATADTSWDNLFTDYGDNSGAWSGGDGAQSLLLPDGKTMWFFGDTYLGAINADYTRPPLSTGLAHNSAVLQNGSTLGPTFAQPRGSGYNFQADYSWVSPPAAYPASQFELLNGDQVMDNGVVYKFMQLADRNLHPQGFAYKLVGTVIESFTYDASNGHLTPSAGTAFEVKDSATSDPVIWGAALLVSGGYVYIYGVQPYNSGSLYLARAPVGSLADTSAWTYYDASPSCSPGSGAWASGSAQATALMTGASEGFSVTDVNGTFVLLSNDPTSSAPMDAVAHYANCPTGFSAASPSYTVFQPSSPFGYLTYEYRIVPQFSDGSNVLVSYSTDTLRQDESCMAENYYNARIYRPRFLDIQLPAIGGPSGPVTTVTAPTPPAGTTPPVPPGQETFHPQSASDNWVADNCQPNTAPASSPALSITSNENDQISLSWTMTPTAMWLYTVTWCDTDEMSCGNNSTVPASCPTPSAKCGTALSWGTRSIDLKLLTVGDKYQFMVETSKAVPGAVPALSNRVTATIS